MTYYTHRVDDTHYTHEHIIDIIHTGSHIRHANTHMQCNIDTHRVTHTLVHIIAIHTGSQTHTLHTTVHIISIHLAGSLHITHTLHMHIILYLITGLTHMMFYCTHTACT